MSGVRPGDALTDLLFMMVLISVLRGGRCVQNRVRSNVRVCINEAIRGSRAGVRWTDLRKVRTESPSSDGRCCNLHHDVWPS